MFKKIIKKVLPQRHINNYFHFPKAVLANMLHGSPARRLKVIGVTGTDGKSTTTNMIYQILKAAGKKVSMVSTINAVIAGKSYDTGFHVTSPDPLMIQKFASRALKNGDEYLVLEVTSHGLDQFRFWGVKFNVGVVTNVTHEHLDYHKSFDNYLKTKLSLLKSAEFAIINSNIKYKENQKVFTFGLSSGDFNQKDVKLKLKIPGDYNIENALASLAVAFSLGIKKEVALKALENFERLEGRMEAIPNNKGIKIFVDFAHTPNALEQVLKALRPLTKGRLISVFGCAGARDTGKRPLMGEVSSRLADITVLTDEDPRFENSMDIINQIISGAKGAKKGINLFTETDRTKAIKLAVSISRSGDTIGIFGKGHEQSMSYLGKERSWLDKKAVMQALNG